MAFQMSCTIFCEEPSIVCGIILCVLQSSNNHCLSDMGMRDRFPDPHGQRGVETVLFNSNGFRIGKVGPYNFENQWNTIRDTVYQGKFSPHWRWTTIDHSEMQEVGRRS
jgi:hypothetical protein